MPGKSDWKFWGDRWDSLNRAMDELAVVLGGQDSAEVPHKETLATLIECLKDFGKKQFETFYKGFDDSLSDSDIPRLRVSVGYPPEYAFSIILDQIACDFEVVQRAACQRMSGGDLAKETLGKADEMARRALKPALDAGLFSTMPAVVTYFQKSPSTRLFPYAPVSLIGIPPSCMGNPTDYLAIPHEIAHYVYNHVQLPDGQDRPPVTADEVVATQIPPNYGRIRNWREEIYADVYACIVGGPVMALDFQDLQLEKLSDVFINDAYSGDGGKHPTPFRRPYIFTAVLSGLDSSNPFIGNLQVRWDSKVNDRVGTDFDRTLTENLKTVVGTLLSLRPSRSEKPLLPEPSSPDTAWYGDLPSTPEDIHSLYTKFAEHINNLTLPSEQEMPLPPAPGTWLSEYNWGKWVAKEKFNLTETPTIRVGDPRATGPGPDWGWIQVLRAAGWTTKWSHIRN